MIKACIFDLDGTLAYTLDSMAVVGNEVVRKYGLKPMPIENYRYYCGNGADMLVKRLLVDAGDPELLHYEEARALYRKEFDKDPFYKIQHYPGMPETLKELKKRGVKLGVCSNKPHEAAVKVVERMFGSQIFDAVMGQSDSVRKKPAPDGPLKIAEQFGIKPEECMYLGDSGTDMQTGKAAGMYTVGVLWGYREKEELLKNGADYLVDSPEDILDLYEEKWRSIVRSNYFNQKWRNLIQKLALRFNKAPQVIGHGDAFPTNFLVHTGHICFIDLANVGVMPYMSDIARLTSLPSLKGDALLCPFKDSVLDAYYQVIQQRLELSKGDFLYDVALASFIELAAIYVPPVGINAYSIAYKCKENQIVERMLCTLADELL